MKSNKKINHANYLRVISDKTYHETRGTGGDESWSSVSDIKPTKLELVTLNDKYWDIVTDFEVEPGDDLYLVWIVYSQGDSFGRATGLVDYIGVYNHIADALHVVNVIRDSEEDQTNIDTRLPSGSIEILYIGECKGYFNYLESVHYEHLHVY